MTDFFIKQNDRNPPLQATLKYVDGAAINLTGAAVKFNYKKPNGATVSRDATIVDAATGSVKYEWEANDTDVKGLAFAEWEITFPDTTELTVPNRGHIKILISAELD